jgi:hypothetical protein
VSHTARLHVLGTAFFAPRYESLAHALKDDARPHMAPSFAIVEGRLRRFTSLATQLHLEVGGTALAHAGVKGGDVHSVFSSALGELETAVVLLTGLADEGAPSPARFAQSVHSAASGLFSIATGNRLASETIAAGPDTFAAALEEAFWIAAESSAPVLLTCADDAAPPLFGSRVPGIALAAAFVVAQECEHPCRRITLETSGIVSAAHEATPPHLHGSTVFPAMLLAHALSVAVKGETREIRVDSNTRGRPVIVRVEGA